MPIKWNAVWPTNLDNSKEKISTWACYLNADYVQCKLCDSKVKYSLAGWTALLEHSDTKKHKNALNALSNQPFLGIGASSSSTSSSQEQEPSTSLQQIPPANNKARAAETKWLFKVAENDCSLPHPAIIFSNV